MNKLSWKEWIGVVVVALLVAGVAFVGLLQIQHWRQDEATLHAVVQLLNYNVAHGTLVGIPAEVPAPPPTPPVAAKPPVPPEAKKP